MKNVKKFIATPFVFVATIVGAYLLNLVVPIDFHSFGIRPRSIDGLIGIPLVVFLHGSFSHLLNNSVPLFILGMLLRSYGRGYFANVTIGLILLSGLLTWIFSPSGLLIGASGLVFAYFSFLICKAMRDKTAVTFLIAGVVILTYGGLLFSLGHFQAGVSWTGHLCGFASGIILAFYGPKQLK